MRCLVVDDQIICRKAVVLSLEGLADCDDAVDGSEAVVKFRAALEKGEPYDLIVLDILMPGIDGHDTAREIRKAERELSTGPQVKIIMLTVLESVNDAMKSFCYGSAAYIVKPASREKFAEKLAEIGLL